VLDKSFTQASFFSAFPRLSDTARRPLAFLKIANENGTAQRPAQPSSSNAKYAAVKAAPARCPVVGTVL
jgi:hypothetical protein